MARVSALLARIPGTSDERIIFGVVALLVVGGLLRLVFMSAWQPAFVGYPDSIVYVQMAQGPVFQDSIHAVGYPLFLRFLHDFSSDLTATIVVQHAMGLVSGVVLYLTVRRVGGPPWLGLVPMAVVVLNGGQMFLEHSPLTEALYILVESAALYAAVRTIDSRGLANAAGWAMAVGVLVGVGATVRVVGLPLVAVFVVGLLLASQGSWRRRGSIAAAAGAGAMLILAWFVIAQHDKTGYTGLTPRAGSWNLYARVAPFADCTKFTPPKGTQMLCETTPESQRPMVEQYDYDPDLSPAVRAFGYPFDSTADQNRRVGEFARTVILHQPLDYLEAVVKGMAGYTQPLPPHGKSLQLGYSYDVLFQTVLVDPDVSEHARLTALLPYYKPVAGFDVNRSQMSFLHDYENATRVQGVLMAALLLLSLAAPFVTRGRVRTIVTLIVVITWVSLVVPVATHWWDSRTTIPVLGTLVAAAAFGAWGLALTARQRLADR